MRTERHWLVEAIRTRLLPEFVQRGFEILRLPESRGEAIDRSIFVDFRFGRLRRLAPRGVEFIEIQMAPRGQAAFRLNIGVVPLGGIETFAGHVPANDVLLGYLTEHYELYQCPLFWTWFSVKHWWWREITPRDYDDLVMRVVRMIPEVEQALREGKQGSHIRLIKINHPIGKVRRADKSA